MFIILDPLNRIMQTATELRMFYYLFLQTSSLNTAETIFDIRHVKKLI